MTDPTQTLAACLPKDRSDSGPIGVDAGAVRNVLSELLACRELLRRGDERLDGGA